MKTPKALYYIFSVFLIAALWALIGLNVLELPAEVTGALIVTWTLLVQYYFRKKQSKTGTA